MVDVQVPRDSDLDNLDYGEREAIFLAEQSKADLLIIDERKGFKAARDRNLRAVGTLFVLEQAAENGLVNLQEAFEKLAETTFYVSPQLLQEILDRNLIEDE